MMHHSVDAQRYHTSCMTLQDLACGELRHETFMPPAMNEVASVWLRWQHEDNAMLAERLATESCKRKQMNHTSTIVKSERRSTANRTTLVVGRTQSTSSSPLLAQRGSSPSRTQLQQVMSLKEMLEVQTRRSQEILAEENANKRPTLRHMCLLGKTTDIALGGVDDLIARARELTSTGRE